MRNNIHKKGERNARKGELGVKFSSMTVEYCKWKVSSSEEFPSRISRSPNPFGGGLR